MITILLQVLLSLAIILGIVLLAGLSYAMIWIFLFSPIKRLDKRNEKLAEMNREYNKIEVEHAKMIEMNDKEREKYNEWAIKIQQLKDDAAAAEKELKRKQSVLAEVTEKISEARNGKIGKKKSTESNE